MKKIKLKLSRNEFNDLLLYVRCVLATEGLTPAERLVDACLSELLHKMLVVDVIVQYRYKLAFTMPWAMALLAAYHEIPSDNTTVRSIASTIHQKTA